MKCILVSVLLLAALAQGGLSGTYTIKPDGTGDFVSLLLAGEAIDHSGLAGHCVFEIYGETLAAGFTASYVDGSDLWTTTFRPGPGEDPILTAEAGDIRVVHYDNVKLESLRFAGVSVVVGLSSGWRIDGCRFAIEDLGIHLTHCTSDTVSNSSFDVLPWGVGPAIQAGHGAGNVVYNNVVNSESTSSWNLVWLGDEQGARFAYNTLRQTPWEMESGSCLRLADSGSYDVRNNVFILARTADTLNACVGVGPTVDSVTLDNNCYFVESLGYAGMLDSSYPAWYGWDGWRGLGYEANGICADPMLVSATDLHLRQGSPCIGAATPIAGINSDIDGDPRDPTHPCIGADEFTGGAVTEGLNPQVPSHELAATVIRSLPAGVAAFDAMGRRVREPKPGVYFVRDAHAQAQAQAQAMRKVILQK